MKNYLLKLEKVTIGYERQWQLGPINLLIERGQFWGVLGPNGSGKTTLIKTVLDLIPPVSGEVITGSELTLGYVPQNESFDSIFPVSVSEIVSMGRYGRVPAGKRLSGNDRDVIAVSMDRVGIGDLRARPFRSLSGGEKQRALLARAIAGEPDVLVLDEPTASVDIEGEAKIMELVKNIQVEKKLAVIMVSHFLNTVTEHSDHVIMLDKDRAFFRCGTKRDVLDGGGPGEFSISTID